MKEKSEWKNEILKECAVEDGAAVEVYTKAGGYLGTGIINKKSKITVRIIGSEHADVIMADKTAFYEKRFWMLIICAACFTVIKILTD